METVIKTFLNKKTNFFSSKKSILQLLIVLFQKFRELTTKKKKKIQQKQRTKTKGIANLPSAPMMYENKRELSKTKQYKKVLNKKVSFETRRKLCLPKPWSCFPCLCCDVTGASESCWGPVPFYATEFNLSTSLPRVSRELA